MKLRRPDVASNLARFRNVARVLAIDLLRITHSAGWPALVGGVLIISSLAMVASATGPMREQIAAADQQRRQLHASARNRVAEPVPAQTQLHNFYAKFPARSTLPDALMTLHRVANSNGLKDTRADFRDAPESGTPLVRVRIDIPVSGSYAAIRNWAVELLETLPTLTLDGMELRRASIGSQQVEARVRFQLLLRSAP
jgi:Tfp pilus assembly protein PilO